MFYTALARQLAKLIRSTSGTAAVAGLLLVSAAAGSSFAGEVERHGQALGDTETVKIQSLLKSPDSYVGKTVRVEGQVGDVCPKMGCWIDIHDTDKADRKIRFKVIDGEIVFQNDASGKSVIAEGVFTAMELDHDAAVQYMEHQAEERGEEFDPSSVTGPMKVYRIDGVGAELR